MQRLSARRSITKGVARAIARAFSKPRKLVTAALVCLGVLALGVACLTGGRLTRVWAKTTIRSQVSSGSAPTFTTFDASGAGTGSLQGTMGVSINAAGDIAGVYLTAPNVAHGFVRAGATGTITEFNAPDAGTTLNQGTFAISIDAGGMLRGRTLMRTMRITASCAPGPLARSPSSMCPAHRRPPSIGEPSR